MNNDELDLSDLARSRTSVRSRFNEIARQNVNSNIDLTKLPVKM
jgi:hypothetical protein